MTPVTSPSLTSAYLLLIEARRFDLRSKPMTKFYSLVIAALVFAPAAYAAVAQAAQIVA